MTPDEIALALQRGKLEQACPVCGRWEAAGGHCSKCFRVMGPDDWYPNGDLGRRALARQTAAGQATTPLKRGRGRPGGVSGHDRAPAGPHGWEIGPPPA